MSESLFINEKPTGFAVETAHNDMPIHTARTQADAITWARTNRPDAALHVARVRDLGDKRVPDHWRKV